MTVPMIFRPGRNVIYMDINAYVEKVAAARREWDARNDKVWPSIREAEEVCDQIILKMRRVEGVTREQIRQALLESGFWFPPDLDVDGWSLDPSVQAYVMIKRKPEFVKLRYKI